MWQKSRKEGKEEGWVREKSNDTAIVRYNETCFVQRITYFLNAMTKYMTKRKLMKEWSFWLAFSGYTLCHGKKVKVMGAYHN